ncbi:hypothetical protein N9F21_04075 [Porticoccaceae bacterium]|nr:hypothetical protein [Porticoccaceae bacterium]
MSNTMFRVFLIIISGFLLASCASHEEKFVYQGIGNKAMLTIDFDQNIVHSGDPYHGLALENSCATDSDFFCIDSALITLSVKKPPLDIHGQWLKDGYYYEVISLVKSSKMALIKRKRLINSEEKERLEAMYKNEILSIKMDIESAPLDSLGYDDFIKISRESIHFTQCYMQDLDKESVPDYFIYDKTIGVVMILLQKSSFDENCNRIYDLPLSVFSLISSKGVFHQKTID